MMKRYGTIAIILFLSLIGGRAFSLDASSSEKAEGTAAGNAAAPSSQTGGTPAALPATESTPRAAEGSSTAEVKTAPADAEAVSAQSETPPADTGAFSVQEKAAPAETAPNANSSQNAPDAAAKSTPANKVSEVDISPSGKAAKSAFSQSVTLGRAGIEEDYKRNRIMQTTGLTMLGVSAVMILAGAAVIEAAPWGSLSRVGISFVGVGLGHFITSAFLLGFSRPIVVQELPPSKPVQIIRKAAYYQAPNGDIYF